MVRRSLMLLIALGSTAHAQVAQPPPPAPAQPPPADPAQLPPADPAQPPPANPAQPTIEPYPGQQPPATQQPPMLQPYPGQQPVVMQPPPPRTVMSKRWAIGVDFGPESYAPNVDGAEATGFGQFELAVRYRIRKPIELGLALHIAGEDDQKLAAGGLYFDFRYRFLAEQPFNIYALASLGLLGVAHEDASDDAKRGRGSLRLGVGAEYRWNWFALILEFRLITVGENDKSKPPALDVENNPYQLSRYKLSGASLALGANFYF